MSGDCVGTVLVVGGCLVTVGTVLVGGMSGDWWWGGCLVTVWELSWWWGGCLVTVWELSWWWGDVW